MTNLPSGLVTVPFHAINRAVLSMPVSVISVPSISVNTEEEYPPPPLPTSSEDMVINDELSPLPAPPVFSINTNYDPSHEKHTLATFRANNKTKNRDRYFATQKERKRARDAKRPSSLSDLSYKVRLYVILQSK